MNWEKLKGFYYVTKYGSFTTASKAINLNQSALSRQIQSLERDLGVKLFFRNKGKEGLLLTQHGESLLKITEDIVDGLKNFQSEVSVNEKNPEGTLTVATTHSYAQHIIVPHLKEFLEKYPKLKVQIICDDEELGFEFKKADVVLKPITAEDKKNFKCYKLKTFKTKVFASPTYIEKFGTPDTFEDLKNHKIISYYNSSNPLGLKYFNSCWLIDKLGPEVDSFLVINSVESYIDCIRNGIGIGYLTLFEKHLVDKKLEIIIEEFFGPDIDIGFITKEVKSKCTKIKALIGFYKNFFKENDSIA